MKLFGFGKKAEDKAVKNCGCEGAPEKIETEPVCSCKDDKAVSEASACCGEGSNSETVSIKILGAGCKKCHQLYENAKKAVEKSGIDAEVEYITDMEKVVSYGVMLMPAVVINEKAVSMGKVLKPDEVIKLIEKE
ncbi:MAG: thioredoxin family protein [Bacillota bacterium]|nr:thioredoxin family protein [Bacillota bacterium]